MKFGAFGFQTFNTLRDLREHIAQADREDREDRGPEQESREPERRCSFVRHTPPNAADEFKAWSGPDVTGSDAEPIGSRAARPH